MIIAVAGRKGGSGKSTLACMLAAEIARYQAVCLLDADPQRSALDWWLCNTRWGFRCDPAGSSVVSDMRRLRRDVDYGIVDLPSGQPNPAVLAAADLVLVPMAPCATDAWSMGKTLDDLIAAKKMNRQLRAAAVLTRVLPRSKLTAQASGILSGEMVPQNLRLRILTSRIGMRSEYQYAMASGRAARPSSRAGKEIYGLMMEIMESEPKKQ